MALKYYHGTNQIKNDEYSSYLSFGNSQAARAYTAAPSGHVYAGNGAGYTVVAASPAVSRRQLDSQRNRSASSNARQQMGSYSQQYGTINASQFAAIRSGLAAGQNSKL